MMSGELKYYTEDSFLKRDHADAFYGFFTRLGGMSAGIYKSLNCGVGSQDPFEHVLHNRVAVAREAKIDANNLLSVYQEHGSHVVNVQKIWTDRPRGDAMVTDMKGVGLGILTADCTPVLFYGTKHNGQPVIGAAHAGWKGALGGVLGNTVSMMQKLGAIKPTIRACVGPCIGKSSYEVSSDFILPFLEDHHESDRFFHSALQEGHAMFDLGGYCAWRLARENVAHIAILDKDTYSNEEEFFSYRRSVHKAEEDYGRQISVIAIRDT